MCFFSLLFIYQEVGIDKQDIQTLLAVGYCFDYTHIINLLHFGTMTHEPFNLDISNDEKTYSDLVVDSKSSTVDDPSSLKPFEGMSLLN